MQGLELVLRYQESGEQCEVVVEQERKVQQVHIQQLFVFSEGVPVRRLPRR
jgi:hypothetical protein